MGSTTTLEGTVQSGVIPLNFDSLTAEQRDLLYRLDKFEAPLYLEEKLLKEGKFDSPEDYKEAFTEFKKFVALTQLYSKRLGMISKKVDDIWHQFILFTPQYREFCDEYLGGYLHHLPRTSLTPLARNGRENFIDGYTKIFGELPDMWKSSSDCDGGEDSPSGWCGPNPPDDDD